MSVKGFKLSDGTVVKYDYSSLDNIVTDSTLSVDGVAADAGAVGDEISLLKTKSFDLDELDRLKLTGLDGSNIEVEQLLSDFNRYEGIFTSNVDESIENWLDEHPEATTSVEDHSLTYEKLVNGTLGFVTPEMFGAIGDGEADDYTAFVNTFAFAIQNSIKLISCTKKNYYISQTLTINSHDLIFDGNYARFIFGTSGFIVAETSYNIDFCNMHTECTFEKGSSGSDVIHFGIIGNTATLKYLAHDIYFRNINMSGGTMGIAANSAKNIIIENCKFSSFIYKGNGVGGYGILLQSSVDVTIHKCTFDSGMYGRHDIYVSVDPGKTTNKACENIVIDECYFTHENLEIDESGYYYSPSTIPIQVRATIGLSISNCRIYRAVGFAVFLGTEESIVAATIKNIIMDSPIYNNGTSEQKSIISVLGGNYGANIYFDELNVLNVPSNYTVCAALSNGVLKLSNAIIGSTRITTTDNSILYLNNIESSINEYFVRFYGTVSGDISNIKCTGLNNPVFKYYIDSGASVNPSIFESKTATLEFTSGSSGFTNYQNYPDGFYYTLCTVIGFEVYLNGSWRSGVVSARTSLNTRTFASLESSGIRLFNDESNLADKLFRITIKQIK